MRFEGVPVTLINGFISSRCNQNLFRGSCHRPYVLHELIIVTNTKEGKEPLVVVGHGPGKS